MKLKFTILIGILSLSFITANAQIALLGKWKLVSITEKKSLKTDFGNKEIFLNFDKKNLSGAACNQFSGTYTISKNRIKVRNLNSTLMACEEMQTDTLIYKVLDKTAYFSVKNDFLILTDKTGKTSLKLQKAKPPTVSDLLGKWRLSSMIIQETPISVGEKPATLIIEKTRIGGNSGCNSYGGNVSVKDSTLKISDIFSTKMFCEGVPENQYFRALDSVERFEIRNKRLVLTDAKKQNQLTFDREAK